MNKLYYTDPLVAAYMLKHFHVEYNTNLGFGGFAVGFHQLLNEPMHNDILEEPKRYYVLKSKNHIFEPLYDDIGIDQGDNVCVRGCCGDWALENGLADEKGFIVEGNVKIIYRNGKPFFMPEVENE